MGECDEGEVEEVGNLARLESCWLGEAVPEAVEVLSEGVLEVGERGGADVIADDKQEESLVLRAAKKRPTRFNSCAERLRRRW